jgi:hypothetical protein
MSADSTEATVTAAAVTQPSVTGETAEYVLEQLDEGKDVLDTLRVAIELCQRVSGGSSSSTGKNLRLAHCIWSYSCIY